MKYAVFSVLAAAMLLCLAGDAFSQERLILQGEGIVVACDAPLEAWARELVRDYPELRSRVEKPLGWSLRSRVGVFLTADSDQFEQMSGSPFVSAFAVPARSTIAIRVSSLTARPYFFNETFQHEFCHLVLHEHIESAFLPKWLDEGVCQWISGSLGEILGGAGRGAAGAVDLSRRAIPLKAIESAFPADEPSLILAYEESRSIVEYISTRYGKGSLLGILERMKNGEDIDAAVRASLHKSLDSVEEEWLRQIKGKIIWLIWLGEYIYEVLFCIAALLTVLGFVRGMLRKRRYGEDDEDEEEDEAEGAPSAPEPRTPLRRMRSADRASEDDAKD